jgi:type I restriction enzyme S subunit
MSEWKTVKLGDVAEIIMGQSPPGESCNKNKLGTPLLNGPTEYGSHHPIPVQYTTEPKKISKKDDILYCVRGSTTGKMNWSDQEYAIGRGVAAIRHKIGSDLNIIIKSILDIENPNLLAASSGSTFPNVSRDQLSEIEVSLPPLPTQKKIAKVLGDLDDKIELNRRMNETLEEMAMAVYRHYFVNFGLPPGAKEEATECPFGKLIEHPEMGMIPEGWSVGKIKDFGRVVTGKTPPTDHAEYYNGKTPFITPTDYKNYQKYLINSDRSISDFGKSRFNSLIISKGSIMITCIGSDMGKIALTSCDVMTNQQINSIVPFDSICCEYLYNFLKSIYEQLTLWARTGTTMPIINKSSFENISLLVPTEKVLLQFTKDILKSSELVLKNSQEIQSLTATRDYLLPRLLSGDVRVE